MALTEDICLFLVVREPTFVLSWLVKKPMLFRLIRLEFENVGVCVFCWLSIFWAATLVEYFV